MKPQTRLFFTVLICVNLCLFFFSGCSRVNSVDPNQVKQIAEQFKVIVAAADAYQQATSATIEQLVASGVIDPNKGEKILKGSEAIDKLQEIAGAIATNVQTANYSDTQGLLTMVETAMAANAATAAWNPYAGLIAAVLAFLSAILVAKLRKAGADIKAVTAKYQAHKQGVEKSVKDFALSSTVSSALVDATLYSNIGHARFDLGVT